VRSPKSREAHGDGVSVVLGDWESQSQGEGIQVEPDLTKGRLSRPRMGKFLGSPIGRSWTAGEPDEVKVSRPVRGGVVGKVPSA